MTKANEKAQLPAVFKKEHQNSAGTNLNNMVHMDEFV